MSSWNWNSWSNLRKVHPIVLLFCCVFCFFFCCVSFGKFVGWKFLIEFSNNIEYHWKNCRKICRMRDFTEFWKIDRMKDFDRSRFESLFFFIKWGSSRKFVRLQLLINPQKRSSNKSFWPSFWKFGGWGLLIRFSSRAHRIWELLIEFRKNFERKFLTEIQKLCQIKAFDRV